MRTGVGRGFKGRRLGEQLKNLPALGVIAWIGIGQEGAEYDCPAHREGSSCPPQVHGGDMAMAEGLLACRLGVDLP